MTVEWTDLVIFILGFALSQATTWIQSQHQESERIKSTCTLLNSEIAFNIKALRTIKTVFGHLSKDEHNKVARQILSSSKATSSTIWNSQLPTLGSSLTSNELPTLIKFYQKLMLLEHSEIPLISIDTCINDGLKAQELLQKRLLRATTIEPFTDEDEQPTNHHTQKTENH